MTDVIIYKKIEVTIIRPSEECIWVENEKAQVSSRLMCLDFSPEAGASLCSVKGGVGVPAPPPRRHGLVISSHDAALNRWEARWPGEDQLGHQEKWLQLSAQQPLVLSINLFFSIVKENPYLTKQGKLKVIKEDKCLALWLPPGTK